MGTWYIPIVHFLYLRALQCAGNSSNRKLKLCGRELNVCTADRKRDAADVCVFAEVDAKCAKGQKVKRSTNKVKMKYYLYRKLSGVQEA